MTGHQFAKLIVSGDILWTGGTYRPFVDATVGSTTADVWSCTGTFQVNGAGANGAKFGPIYVNLPQGGVPPGRRWEVMEAPFITLVAGGADPGFDLPNQWGLFKGRNQNNTADAWYMESK